MMHPDFRLSDRASSADDAQGSVRLRCRRNRKNIARKPRGDTLHCNRGRLRTLLPRFRTTKTHNRHRGPRRFAMQQLLSAGVRYLILWHPRRLGGRMKLRNYWLFGDRLAACLLCAAAEHPNRLFSMPTPDNLSVPPSLIARADEVIE